jgi:hypothetical protein
MFGEIKRMKNNLLTLFILVAIFALTTGCSINLAKSLSLGEVQPKQFKETVQIEVHNGLIFLPVTIQGKVFNFLFDSGAPFSISKKLQNEFGFKIITKGNIVDSDHNRKSVNWAQVDAIRIGDVDFLEQTAFIGDFDKNPLLKCLNIDGIVGSNFMRHCIWTIDQKEMKLVLSNVIDQQIIEESTKIPFTTDFQYNIFLDINIGDATVRNILMDYGSNGSIALSEEIFSVLKNRDIIKRTILEKGNKQSGIIGKPVELNREITFVDSVVLGELTIDDVMSRTGETVSIGNKLMSRFKVTIDWKSKNLYFKKNETTSVSKEFAGFNLGYDVENGIIVQRVIESSDAYKKGIRANMKVLKLDDLDFENDHDFCDYAKHKAGDQIYLQVIDATGQKKEFNFEKTIF